MSTTVAAPTGAPTTSSPPVRPPSAAPTTVQKGPTPPASFRAPSSDKAPAPVASGGEVPGKLAADSPLKTSIAELWGNKAKPAATAAPAGAPATGAPAEASKPAAGAEAKPAAIAPTEVKPPVEPPPNPPEAAPADTDIFADIKPPEGLSEKGMQGWKALKTNANKEITEAKRKLDAALAEIDTLKKATPAEKADVERLRAEHQAALDRLSVLDVQHHPDFVNKYVAPKEKAISEAKTLLSDNGITDAVDFDAMMGKSRAEFSKAVSELTSKMQDFDRTAFVTSMRDAYRLTGEAKSALANANDLKAGIESRTAAKQKQAFEETWGHLGDADNFLKPAEIPATASPEEKAELTAYNAALPSVRQAAEANAFGRLDAKGVAAIATKAAVLDFVIKTTIPRINKEFSTVVQERNQLAEELKAIKAAKGAGSFESTPAETPEKFTIQGGIKKVWGSSGMGR